MAKWSCDLCGTGTYIGTDGSNRYCPSCESRRDIEKIVEANEQYFDPDEIKRKHPEYYDEHYATPEQ